MIDYLEWKQEEADTDALWEAVRQLAEQPAAAKENNSPTVGQTGEDENVWTAEFPLKDAVERGERLARRAAGLDAEPRGIGEKSTPLEGEATRGLRLEQRTGEYTSPDWMSVGRSGRETAVQGEMSQAERLDRIFRRDGRRYDGGFFLY